MNEKVVKHLREVLGVGPDELPTFYDTFLRTLDGCLDQLRAAESGPDYSAIRAATHTIMGFSRNIGATDVGDAASALNAAAHAADPAACRVGIAEIAALCDQYRNDAALPGDTAR